MTDNRPELSACAAIRDTPAPSAWIRRWLPAAQGDRLALDLACGSGRHSLLARDLGYRVLAVDRDAQALATLQGSGVQTLQEDLEHGRWSFCAQRFDLIVCTHYLFRPRLDLLASLLAPGGRLLYETFAQGNERFGRPSNPAFLLRPGELLQWAHRAGLHVVAYEDGVLSVPRAARVQRLAAVRAPLDDALIALD